MKRIFEHFLGEKVTDDPFLLPRWVPLGNLICQAMSGWTNHRIGDLVEQVRDIDDRLQDLEHPKKADGSKAEAYPQPEKAGVNRNRRKEDVWVASFPK